MYLFYKIGSRNEGPGITGISHFFEHMMFNGAKNYGPKAVRQRDGKGRRAQQRLHIGRRDSLRRLVPLSSALDLMFDMEADRMQKASPSIRRSFSRNAA